MLNVSRSVEGPKVHHRKGVGKEKENNVCVQARKSPCVAVEYLV